MQLLCTHPTEKTVQVWVFSVLFWGAIFRNWVCVRGVLCQKKQQKWVFSYYHTAWTFFPDDFLMIWGPNQQSRQPRHVDGPSRVRVGHLPAISDEVGAQVLNFGSQLHLTASLMLWKQKDFHILLQLCVFGCACQPLDFPFCVGPAMILPWLAVGTSADAMVSSQRALASNMPSMLQKAAYVLIFL